MKRTNFDDLLHRYVTGKVTEQEKAKIEAWLDVKKTDEGADMTMTEADEERLFRLISSNVDEGKVKAFRPEADHPFGWNAGRWLRVAAAVVFLATASYVLWYATPRTYNTTAGQEIAKVILDDGTLVWLGKNSRLTYDDDHMGTRLASLSGEALFEVAKDPGRPFSITCGDVTVSVLGTSFHLRSRGDTLELQVLTGKVSLASKGTAETTVVLPHEVARYVGRTLTKAGLSEDQVTRITARTEYNMRFVHTTMAEVLSRIEEKFEVKVKLENRGVNRCRLTADFTDRSLEDTLAMLAELLDIQFSVDGNTVSITGNGCN